MPQQPGRRTLKSYSAAKGQSKRRRHTTRAALRDASLILRDSGPWLLAFVAVWLGFGLLVWRFFRADGATPLSEALYIAFTQLLFETNPLPQTGWLKPLFFLAQRRAAARPAIDAPLRTRSRAVERIDPRIKQQFRAEYPSPRRYAPPLSPQVGEGLG